MFFQIRTSEATFPTPIPKELQKLITFPNSGCSFLGKSVQKWWEKSEF